MIKSLSLQNFQSHKNTHFEFSPGVNIIVGRSDCGKTAIIRALRWLKANRPQGTAFRSNWGGMTSVVCEFDDCTITRSKDKQDLYILDETEFKAFRTEVPDEITQALNIADVNLQMQLDSHFLLSETPGAVAQHFNKVARLDKIDTGLQAIQSEIRQINNTLSYKEKDITSAETDLLKYGYLDKVEIELEALEQLEEQYTQLSVGKTKLQKVISQIQTKNTEIQDASVLLDLEEDVNFIISLYGTLTQIQINHFTLSELINELDGVEMKISKGMDLIVLSSLVNVLFTSHEEKQDLIKQKNDLLRAIQSIENTDSKIDLKQKKLEADQIKFNKLIGDQCPLCGNLIKK